MKYELLEHTTISRLRCLVASETMQGAWYIVTQEEKQDADHIGTIEEWKCTCKAFTTKIVPEDCKHIKHIKEQHII